MSAQVLADKYEILDVLGTGGMGVVYKARHLLMKRIVAIKMLHESLTANELMRKRFEQEAQAISALNHPNILTVFDFGVTEDNKPYLVVEYLEGTSLEEVLQEEEHLEVPRVVHIFKQATSGLAQAHEKGIIHRDLKPGNIMLITVGDDKDFVKIVDFGIAKLVQESTQQSLALTSTGEIFGSPLYMSPEQCRGRKLDPRSDIYSLGCVMYHTLTGKRPFIAQDLPECLYKQVHEIPPSFSEIAPELNIPDGLEKIVFKAMGKEPSDRFDNMLDFKQAIDNFEAGTPLDISMPPTKPKGATTVVASGDGIHITAPGVSPSTAVPISTGAISADAMAAATNTIPPAMTQASGFKPNKKMIGIAAGIIIALGAIGAWYSNANSPAVVFDALTRAGQASFKTGNYADAESNFQKAYDMSITFGQNSMRRSQAIDDLGTVLMAQRKYDKLAQLAIQDGQIARAVTNLTHELETVKKVNGEQSQQASDLLQLLGKLSEKEGDYARAEDFYSQSLTIKRALAAKADAAAKAAAEAAKTTAVTAANEKDKSKTAQEKSKPAPVKKPVETQEIKTLTTHLNQVHKQKVLHPKPRPRSNFKPYAIQAPKYEASGPSFTPEKVETKPVPQEASKEETKKRGFFGSLGHGVKNLFHKEK